MTKQARAEKSMSVHLACYVYGREYHTGLGSRAYRLLCTCTRPGHLSVGNRLGVTESRLRKEDPEAAALLDKLIERGY